jgi:signal transduction histidine kinase
MNDWARGNFTISKWEGVIKQQSIGKLFEDIEILGFVVSNNNPYLIYKEQNQHYLGKFDKELNIEKILLLEFTNYKELSIESKQDYILVKNEEQCFVYNPKSKFKKYFANINDIALHNQDLILLKQFGASSEIIRFNLENETQVLIAQYSFGSDKSRLFIVDDFLIAVSDFTNSAYLYAVNLKTKSNYSQFLDIQSFNVNFIKNENDVFLYFVTNKDGQYFMNKAKLEELNNPASFVKLKFPNQLIEIYQSEFKNNNLVTLFKNGIYICDLNLKPIAYDNFKLEDNQLIEYYDKNFIILRGINKSLIVELSKNQIWFVFRFLDNYSIFFIPALTVLLVLLIIQSYRSQRRLLNAILNLPTTGFVIVLNKEGNIMKMNEQTMELLELSFQLPLKRYYKYYLNEDAYKPLEDIIETAISNRESFNQKITIIKNEKVKDFLCNVIVLRNIAGFDRGVLITGLDITEELESKRLSNWAQLAHDLQTNLSTIRLNAEQMEFNDDNINETRRSKILHQVNIVINRIRDVITVGRGDMLQLQSYPVNDLFKEVKSEFDSDLYTNINIEIIPNNLNILCDYKRLIRAIRNATENSLKVLSQSKNGHIVLSAYNDVRFTYLSIKDNGPGMTEEIKEKVLSPFYSANTSGGSGIGSMIMKNVVEQHGGNIIINSSLGEGTEILFKIPNRKA